MSKKRIMRAFKINEISAVDKPAQAGARAMLMKRDDTKVEDESLIAKGAMLTSSIEGHSHLIYCLEDSGGSTSYSQMIGEPHGHTHPYVITNEGKVIIGEAEGHTHEIVAFGKVTNKKNEDDKEFGPGDYAYVGDIEKTESWKLRLTDIPGGTPDPRTVSAAVAALSKLDDLSEEELTAVTHRVSKAWLDANPEKTQDELPDILKAKKLKTSKKEIDMTKEEMEAILAKKDAELTKANQIASLSDVEKAHYNTLADADKETFLAKSADDRKSIIKNLSDSNPVVYKSVDGHEFRKNDDPRLVSMAKSADENAKVAKAATEALDNANLQKRALEEFKNLPGTAEEKAALLKSIDGIADEAVRKSALAAVKAGDNALSGAFVRKGATNGSTVESGSPTDELDKMAKKYAEENKVNYHKAYDVVTQTEEGRKLYQQTLN